MKKISILVLTLLFANLNAQIVGPNAYIDGTLVEIGIDGQGGFEGCDITVSPEPAGMHYRGMSNYFGFVANPQNDGWVVFDGDFFSPGSPENGWGIEIVDGATNLQANNNRNWLFDIPGAMVSHSVVGDCITATWQGAYSNSGYDLGVRIVYNLNVNDLFYTTTVTITNNGPQDIDEFFYFRTFDPDNNAIIDPLSYTTTNTIVSQPYSGACDLAHVSATSVNPHPSYVGLAAVGPEYRVYYGGFSNRDGSDMWNGSAAYFPPLVIAPGSVDVNDEAIGLSHRTTNFGPGEVFTSKFVTILSDAASSYAINNLFQIASPGFTTTTTFCDTILDTLTLCNSATTTLDVTGGSLGSFVWNWSPAAGLSTTVGPSVTVSTGTSTLYTVTGTPTSACFAPVFQQVYVEVFPSGVIVTCPNDTVCGGGVATLTASGAGAGGIYNWTADPTLSATIGASVTASPLVTTTYTVSATATNGCTGDTTVTVVIADEPVASFTTTDSLGCATFCTSMTSTSSVATGTITSLQWLVDGSNAATTPVFNNCFLAGVYDISLVATTELGCRDTLTKLNHITSLSSTIAQFQTDKPSYLSSDADITINNFSLNNTTAFWDFGDGNTSTSTSSAVLHSYSDTGLYCITLITNNAGNCPDTADLCITITPDVTFFIPNSFTVNGNGLNEEFFPKGYGIRSYKMTIYDRWGKEIFTSKENGTWNGNLANGQEVPQGVYTYYITMEDYYNKQHEYRGHVNLIR